MAPVEKPTFLSVSPDSRTLYAVSEVRNWCGEPGGAIGAWHIRPENAALEPINILGSGGDRPTHISLDSRGRVAAVAHYGDGSIAMFPVLANGALGPCSNYLKNTGSSIDRERQRSAHAHGCFFSPDDSLLVEPDLGADRLYMYRTGGPEFALIPEPMPFVASTPGSGPRHFVFHPDLSVGYTVNELASTITRYCCSSGQARLVPLETISTLDPQYSGANIAAEIAVDRAGSFIYCSNRGADDIAVFGVDHEGRLTLIQRVDCEGRTPRHFALDPSQSFVVLCNQDSNNVVVFARNSATGKLQSTGIQIQIDSPTCVDFAFHQVMEK